MKLDMERFQPEAVEEGMDPSVCTQGTPTQDTDNFFQKLRNGSIVFVAFALFVAAYLFLGYACCGGKCGRNGFLPKQNRGNGSRLSKFLQ